MKNVEIKAEKKTLVIKVDLSQRLGPTKSGKATMVGTTNGFTSFAHDGKTYSVGLNVVTKE